MGQAEPDRPSFHDHFSHRAEGYALYRPHYPGELVDFLFDLTTRIHTKNEIVAIPPSQRVTVWESGCGSGQLSEDLARRFDFVHATDASAKQIARATPHRNIEYRVARADESGLPDHSVDMAVAAQAAHWFDLEPYYAEVRRVAQLGGHIALIVYGIPTINDAMIHDIIGRFYRETLGGFWPPQRRLVEEEYRTLPFPFDELSAPRMEMTARWTLPELLGYVETWSAVGELNKARGRAEIESFRNEVSSTWGEPTLRRIIRWPLSMRLGRV